MEIVAQVNNSLLIRKQNPFNADVIQEAWLAFGRGTVTVVADPHGRGEPYNAIAFTADDLRQLADMLDAREQ